MESDVIRRVVSKGIVRIDKIIVCVFVLDILIALTTAQNKT